MAGPRDGRFFLIFNQGRHCPKLKGRGWLGASSDTTAPGCGCKDSSSFGVLGTAKVSVPFSINLPAGKSWLNFILE